MIIGNCSDVEKNQTLIDNDANLISYGKYFNIYHENDCRRICQRLKNCTLWVYSFSTKVCQPTIFQYYESIKINNSPSTDELFSEFNQAGVINNISEDLLEDFNNVTKNNSKSKEDPVFIGRPSCGNCQKSAFMFDGNCTRKRINDVFINDQVL